MTGYVFYKYDGEKKLYIDIDGNVHEDVEDAMAIFDKKMAYDILELLNKTKEDYYMEDYQYEQ